MIIELNGEKIQVSDRITLEEFVVSQDYAVERVLASVNGQVQKIGTYSEVSLNDGDKVELFSFVGGG